MPESIEQISFRLTAGELAEQERAVAALRSSAGTVLASASVAGSFLAVGARHSSAGFCDVAAMICFVLCSATAIWVLLPRPFVFAFRGAALLRTGMDRPELRADSAQAYRAATRWIEPQVYANRKKITALEELMIASSVLLATEMLLWFLAIASYS